MDGEFVDTNKASVSVFDHGLLYGDGCFEGIRVYNGRILKLRSHVERMFESAAAIRLQPGYCIEEIEEAVNFARNSKFPEPENLFDGMWANPIPKP